MLFDKLAPIYLSENDRPILSKMEMSYQESITINQSFWAEADVDSRFEAGDQTLYNEFYGNIPASRRKQFNFNRIRRIKNMISGYQRRNRKSIIVTPIENADNETADQFTKIIMNVCKQENVLETISQSFEQGGIVTGMNLLQVWMDYREDPISGNIKVNNCAYNEFLIDPYFRKLDLSDCNYVWKRSFLSKREIISLLPDWTDLILSLSGEDTGSAKDAKFMFMPESYNFGVKNLLTYDEYYYRDFRTQKLLVDTQTGETMEWKVDDKEKLERFLSFYPTVTVIEQEIPTVKLAIVVQGRVITNGPNVLGIDNYPFVPVVGYYNPQIPYYPIRVQGVVRGLRDAQFLYNRRRIIELDILESQVASGFIYKENALVNPNDVFMQGQGKGIALKSTAQMTDVLPIQPPQVPPSMIQLSELLAKEIQEISGVNEELLGSATDDKAGILSMLRQGAGLTTLQPLFDQLDQSMKLLGKLFVDLIQTNYTPGKIKRILQGQEPTQQFYNKLFGKYDAVVEEGLNTSTQKQMQFQQLVYLKEIGVPVPDAELLNAATLQNKKELIQVMEQEKQQMAQAQQQQAQIQMQELQARAELSQARAKADMGLWAERTSRVQENRALAIQKLSEANKNDEQATLEKIKAIKELESIDLEHLNKLLLMSNMLKAQEQAQTKVEKDLTSS